MNNLNGLNDFSFEKNYTHEGNQNDNESIDQKEKILCSHCGRTSSNGIRCLGICVADNEY